MDPEQLAETVLDPRTRTIKQITIEDAERAMQALQVCMGKDASARRSFIEENAHKVSNPF